MSDQKPLNSMKKTFFYNFFSSEDDEESFIVNNTLRVATRQLVEIRDINSAPEISVTNPWRIMKKITRDEVVLGKLEILFFETFEYILRYWEMDVTKRLVNGCKVCVEVWDLTEENNDPKKYEGRSVCLRKLYDDNYSLSIMELFNDRGLGVGDEIGLYCDPRTLGLMFKIFSQVRPQ